MASDEKERLSNNEFIELIPHLSLSDLLLIEYRVTCWLPMLTTAHPTTKLYRCNLCGVVQYGIKNTTFHIDGKKHKAKMQIVEQFFHPNYTYAKHQVALAKGIVQEECNAANVPKTNNLQNNEKKQITQPTNSKKNIPPSAAKKQTVSKISTIPTPSNTNKPLNSVNTVKKVTTAKPNVQSKSHTGRNTTTTTANKPITNAAIKVHEINAENTVSKSVSMKPIQVHTIKSTNQQNNNNVRKTAITLTAEKSVKNKANTNRSEGKALSRTENVEKKEIQSTIKKSETEKKESLPIIKESDPNICQNQPIVTPQTVKPEQLTKNVSDNNTEQTNQCAITKPVNVENYPPVIIKTECPDKESNAEIQLQQSQSEQSQRKNKNSSDNQNALQSTVKNVHENISVKKEPTSVTTSSYAKETESTEFIKHVKVEEIDISISSISTEPESSKIDNSNGNKQSSVKIDVTVIELEDPFNKSSNIRTQVKKTPNINLKSISLTPNINHKTKEDNAMSTINIEEIHVQGNKTLSGKLNTVCDDQQSVAKAKDTDTPKIDNLRKEKDTSSNLNLVVINPYAVKNVKESSLKDVEIIDSTPDIIVIDDDREPDPKPSRKLDQSISSEEGEPLRKKQKLLLNPAAALVEKETRKMTESDETSGSRYTTNKIIIPSKHKGKQFTTDSATNNEPSFSYKTNSCKSNDDILGLIGVEYVIKIMKNRTDSTPRYECGLCELILDGYAMQNHLLGYSHRLKFSEKHFPSAMRQYKQFIGSVPEHEVYKIMAPVLEKLAIAIEKYHGRDLPYECYEREFNINRHDVLTKVFSLRHASEQYGPSFTHVVNAKEVDELIAQRHNYVYKSNPNARKTVFDKRPGDIVYTDNRYNQPINSEYTFGEDFRTRRARTEIPNATMYPQIPSQPQWPVMMQPSRSRQEYGSVDNETHKLMVEDFLRETARNSREPRIIRSHSKSRPSEHMDYRSRSPLISTLRRNSLSPLREDDIWQAYRHLVDQKLIELNNVFATYRKDPENHPLYNEEWQKFWKRRKDELIAAGLDHRTYNYQPEWVRFFEVRIEELYSEDIENLKIQCRERLCLPMSNDELIDTKYHVQVAATQSEEHYDEPAITTAKNAPTTSTDNYNLNIENTSKVVAVLRLMTALEDHLGSLGPKIIDLLAKALQIEKSTPENINAIILTTENCFLLETAMEKFKGLVIASLLEGSKERTLRKVISEIDALLKTAETERKKGTHSYEKSSTTTSLSISQSIRRPDTESVPAINTKNITTSIPADSNKQTDKKELAAKLAAVLAAKGKTDLNAEELQELVAMYTMFEKKKRDVLKNTNPTVTSTHRSNSASASTNQKSLSDTLAELQKSSLCNVKESVISQDTQRPLMSFDSNNSKQWPNSNNAAGLSVQSYSMGFNNNMQNTMPSNAYNYASNINANQGLGRSIQNFNSNYFTPNLMNANGNFYNNNNTNNNNNNNNNSSNFGRQQMQGRIYSQQQQLHQQQQQQLQQQQLQQHRQQYNLQPEQQATNIGYGMNQNQNQNWMSRDRRSFSNGNSSGFNVEQNSNTGRDQISGWRNK